VAASDATGLLVAIIGHVAADPAGELTSPTSFHAALYLKPDDPCHCSGTWPMTLSAHPQGGIGGILGTLVKTPNYAGDAIYNSEFTQLVRRPAGMSDCDFIHALISAAASYQNNLPYSTPSIPSGAMSPGQYNSNSFVSGVLTAVGATPPSIYTGGQFQLPGYQNPIPLPPQH
jgi:hypothetical protein